MRTLLTSSIVFSAVVALCLCPAPRSARADEAPAGQPAAKAADVPVRAVVLFSSGVGYFEHFGLVKGNTSAELRFKTNQINDILKSLILQSDKEGKVSTITYPSQDPLAKTLRSFQIDITSNPSLAELLNQLRGAKVTVAVQTEKLAGTILGVEKKHKPVGDKGMVEYWVLNLLTGATIRAINLDEVRDLNLEDAQLQEELHKALAALAQARDQDKKPVVINFNGDGDRHVSIGYVVETPIWKTSYRLILGKDKPMLQGWAIVENQTDNDWNNVQLSLVSGRPISFVQDLYQPLYIPRPIVVPELYASLRPQTYEGGIENTKQAREFAAAPMAPPAPKPGMARASGKARGGRGEALGLGAAASDTAESFNRAQQQDEPIDPTASVASVASAAKIGELFEYTVGNVSLPRQRSAMIPIIVDTVELEKISIYNQSVLPKNPLYGARLKNTTDKHLLAGPITVFDAHAYAGDASVDNIPPGQERILSYGIDLQMRVDATKNRQDTSIVTGKLVKGVLHIKRKHVLVQEYLLDNKSTADKAVIVEHPIHQGWKLVDTVKPIETTEVLYRFKDKVEAGKAVRLVVNEELVQSEVLEILNADIGQVQFYARTGEIPQNVRDALAQAIGLRQAMVDTERQIQQRRRDLAAIAQEQKRIRENMASVKENTDYHIRLQKKLDDQETVIEKKQGEIEDLQNKVNQQRQDLESYLMKMNVG